jgi:hypothetical protein
MELFTKLFGSLLVFIYHCFGTPPIPPSSQESDS